METTERLSEAETVQRIQGYHHPEGGEEKEDGEDPDSDDMCQQLALLLSPPQQLLNQKSYTANQFLCTLAQQKAYLLRYKLPSGATDALKQS